LWEAGGDLKITGLKRERAGEEGHGATIFQTSWSIYDLLAEKNYMHHREIYKVVGNWLGRWGGKRYSILDLGCGNTRFLAPCLRQHAPGKYLGVDLSATALEEAKEYLSELESVELRQGEMVEALAGSERGWEVIFSGYALHHLDEKQKGKFFSLCWEKLAPGSSFLLVDVVREEEETREEYIERYVEFMRKDWTEVPREQLDEACAHVQAFDFPETESALCGMGKRAGFANMDRLIRFGPHQVWEFGGT